MSNKQVKGTAASGGKVKGTVKIVNSEKDISKVKGGDIIVSKRTNPKHMPAIKKASALVTDIGGSTSHAVIIAREMSLPCIIGTGNASLVFKDNDFVEVDAETGVVSQITGEEYNIWIKEREAEELEAITVEELRIRPDVVVWFKGINKNDIPLVGGKGANLGEMSSLFPIPNGFCITVNAYKHFLDENDLENEIYPLLKELDIEETEKLDEASKKIHDLIMAGKISDELKEEVLMNYNELGSGFVAVRSSATAEDLPNASFAGQQATFLNVKGEEDLISSVKECWASLFTSRAIYYRVINEFRHEQVLISVVVQEMVESVTAGVMFSVNPVTRDRNELIIEGSFGLGETVVSGQVTPDSHIVTKNPLKIKETMINEKNIALYRDAEKGHNKEVHLDSERANTACLTEEQVLGLAELAMKIEEHYGKPQDIEWAVDPEGKLRILQSRPITTL